MNKTLNSRLKIFLILATLTAAGCTSSSSDTIDSFFSPASNSPILNTFPQQFVTQETLLKLDFNNIKKGLPGNDDGMTYVCTYDTLVDGVVASGQPCTDIPLSTLSFDAATGILLWTPHAPLLGNYELKITGTNKDGSSSSIVSVGVRLSFSGISSLTQITGTSVKINWTPNTSAVGYQIFTYNNLIGQWTLAQAITGGSLNNYNLTGLTPNQGYTLKVQAVDQLGNLDGNVVSKSFTTTSLTKFSLSPLAATTPAGTPLPITVQAYSSDGSLQTVGGLTITPQVNSGTSTGTFSPVIDNGDGTYSFTYTPNTVGTPVSIGVTTNMSFFLNNTTDVTVVPGPASSSNSSLVISSNSVVSGQSAAITATVRDSYNNPIASGITVGIVASGGSSTGSISAVTNNGDGTYTANYTGITAGSAQTLRFTVNGVNLNPTASVQVIPGVPVSSNSSISVSNATVTSGSTVTVTAILKDINSNPVPSGIFVTFNKAGGTSTGTFGLVVNAGAGVYTTTYTGALAGTAQTLTVSSDGVALTPTATITVIPGAVSLANSNLAISNSTVVSGSFVTVTATLRDASNNAISSGVAVTFSASGGTSTGNFASVTNQGNGVYTTRYTGVLAGTQQNVSVLINGVPLAVTVPVQVIPGAPDPVASTLSVSAATVVSNASVTLTATLKDANNNPLSSGLTVTFAAQGGTSTGNISGVTNAGGGVYTATYTGITSGTAQTINVLVGGAPLGPTVQVTVLPAPYSLTNSSFTTSNGTVTSGTSATLTARLVDVNNNPIAASSFVTFALSGGTSTGNLSAVVNQGGGVYTATYAGVVAGTAQTVGVLINGVATTLTVSELVVPNVPSAANSSLVVSPTSIASGSSATVTATLKDLNNNTISSGVTVAVLASGGTSSGTLAPITNVGGGIYSTTYTGVNSGTAQTLSLTVDGTALGPTATITVVPGSLYSLNSSLTSSQPILSSGSQATITAVLRDTNNNPVTGTIAFTKTGGTSTGTFGSVVNQGNGTYTITYTGLIAGSAQSIGVTINGVDSGLSATQSVVPGAPNSANSTISVSNSTVVSGASVNVTGVLKDINNNTISSGVTVSFSAAGGGSTGNLSALTNVGSGVYTATYTGVVAGSAQTLSLLVGGTPLGPTTTITVTPGALNLSNSSLTATNSTVVSGTQVTLTATLKDVNNNPVSGAVLFTKSGGTSTGNFGTLINLGSGVYTTTYLGVTAGSAQTIGVTIGGVDSGMSVTETVIPAAPSSVTSQISVSAGSIVSGSSATVQATILDLNSNPISSGVVVGFTATGGSSTGNLSTVTNQGSGVYTATYTGVTAGSAQTLNVTIGGVNLGPVTTITVVAGSLNLANSSLTTTNTTVVSNTSVTITATLRDGNNNPVPGAVAFTKSGGTSTGNFGSVVNQGNGVYTVTYTGIVAGSAQTLGVTIGGVDAGLSVSETVVPGSPDPVKSSISAASPTVASGSADTITATILDINNNPITSGIAVTFSKTGGSSTGTFGSVTNAGNGQYTINYTGVLAGTPQTIAVVVGGTALGPTTSVSVIPGNPSSTLSTLTVSASTVTAGQSVTLTANIVDSNGNSISSGLIVDFMATGGTSTGSITPVTNQGSGVYTASYTGLTAGSAQTLQTTVNGAAFGPIKSIQVLVGAPSAANSQISISPTTLASGSIANINAVIKDAYNNPITTQYAITFDTVGGSSTGNFGTVTNAGNGSFSVPFTGVGAGTTVTVRALASGSPISGLTGTLQVIPGPFSTLTSSLTTTNSTVISNTTVTLTATLRDANSNPVPGVVVFTKTGGTSTGNFGSLVNQGNGVYTITYTGITAGTAQTIGVTIGGVDVGLSASETVIPGSPDPVKSTISAASPTVASGSIDTITATILDINNNPISSGIVVTFSKTGGSSTGNFSSVTNGGNGQYLVNYSGLVAGTPQTIAVLIGGVALGPSTSVSVVPGSPSSTLSTFTVSANTVVSGQSVTLTANIVDANGNAISSGMIVNFTATGGTSTGSIASVVNQGSGVYTSTYTGITAGTAQTLQTTINGAAFGPIKNVQVLVGAPNSANSSLSISPSTLASGSNATISAVIRDAQNNPITTEYTITFDTVGGSGTGNFGSVTNAGGGNFSVQFTGVNAGTANTVRVLANGSPISGLTGTIQVVPGAFSASTSTFTIGSSVVQSGTSTTLSVNLRDANSNPISTGATVSFGKSTGVSDGTIGSVTNGGSGNYSASYTAVTQGAAQTITLLVNGSPTTMTVSVTVTSGPPTQMSINAVANPINSIDCIGPYTVTLLDAANNTTYSTSNVSIALSASPANSQVGTLFSDSSCSTGISSLSIPALQNSTQFYYKSYIPQSFTLTLTPTPNTIAPSSFSINNVPVISWIGAAVSTTFTGTGPSTLADDTLGGFVNPTDTLVDGTNLYVVDNGMYRILKFDLTTNTLIGWIGQVGITEGLQAYDGSGACSGLSVGSLTPVWCTGGRATNTNVSTLVTPRSIAKDSTYLYVTAAGNHRILRFKKSDGSFQGWIGRIGSTTGIAPSSCLSAGVGAATPTWCTGGSAQTGTLDGHLNNPQGIVQYGGVLYVADYGNQRIQSFSAATGAPGGWIGNVNVAPSSTGQLATCSPIPTSGNATPGWCLSATTGTAQTANRNNLSTNPSEVLAPNEGFNNPIALTTDGTYLYIGDAGNIRVVRANLTTGAFAGWVGYNQSRSLPGNQPSISPNANGYTSNWTTGGQTNNTSNTNGFGTIRGLENDGTYLYVSDDYHRVIRINLSNGQGFTWIGRTSASPTGGYTGCSSTPVNGVTPGWCLGGNSNRLGNINSSFYNPYGLSASGTQLYVTDYNNFRVQIFTLSTGVFAGWIGGNAVNATTWSRSIPANAVAARWGTDDYSFGDYGSGYNGIGIGGGALLQTDSWTGRLKLFDLKTGAVTGYVGQINIFPPTGPLACVGYTSGLTPTWCTGGGRTTGNSSAIQGYNNPYGITTDGTSVYVADYSNHRIDTLRLSDGLYLGWIGNVNSTPTDGTDPNCLTVTAGNPTPGWCIGGTAQSGTTNGKFNAPRAVFYDSAINSLFAVDNSGRLMQIAPSNGQFQGVVGALSAGTGCTLTSGVANGWCATATGSGTSNAYGGLNAPSAVATNTNYIFIVDSANHRLLRFNKSTGAPNGIIAVMNNNTNLNTTASGGACNGLSGFPKATPGWCFANSLGQTLNTTSGSGDNSFSSPRGVWADSNYVYVSDTGNNRIVRIDANTGAAAGWKGLIGSTTGMTDSTCISAGVGAITPKWCTGGTAAGSKKLGGFDTPQGIGGDTNYIYVLDGRNNRTQTIPK